MGTDTKTKQWLDTLRALATLGVIIIHVSSPLVKMTYGKNLGYWWIGNATDSAVRFAVPLFLMLSGATLLAREYHLAEFYKRRFLRVLLPFLFWIVVYGVYRWCILIPRQQPNEILSILQWAGGLFLKEGISKHFWYIYMILFIYLWVPFIGKMLQKWSNLVILCIVIGWVVLAFFLRSVPLNMYNWSGDYGSRLLGYILYTGYLILGYYLSRLPEISIRTRYWAALVFLLSVGASAGLTYFFSRQAHRLDLTMYSYLTLNTIIQSTAIFVWFKDSVIKNRYFITLQQTISNYSYGIYLVHILVIGIFFNNGIFWTMAHPAISLPAVTLLTLITSFGMIYILRKIPFGKYISG